MSWDTDWLTNRARITPDRVAVVNGASGEEYTYIQLNNRAENIACSLLNQGIDKGDRVGLISPNNICYIDLFFACMKIGAIFVPLNWRLSKQEMDVILEDCKPKMVFYMNETSQFITKDYLGIACNVEGKTYKKWVADVGYRQITDIQIDAPLAIIYTGGTTGKPKGVVLTHQSIFYNTINTINSWNITANDTTLTSLPMFHTGGLNVLTLPLLHIGGKVIIVEKFDPVEVIHLLNKFSVTIAIFVPTMYHFMIQTPEFIACDFPSMHTFLSGGAPCSYKIYEAFEQKGLRFKEGYGLTEAGPNNFYIDPKDVKYKRGSVGKPMLYNKVKILNEDGIEVNVGEVGEIVIQGAHMFHHYWNRPEATQEAIKSGWLYTGDLGKKDKDGYFYIVGRKKDMIITGGENVYPLEVEHVIAKCKGVKEVAVVGIKDEKWGEFVAAFIVKESDNTLTGKDVEIHCRSIIAGYKTPRRIVFLPELPKTAVGKIDKKRLEELGEMNKA